jgi:hypothetical protein
MPPSEVDILYFFALPLFLFSIVLSIMVLLSVFKIFMSRSGSRSAFFSTASALVLIVPLLPPVFCFTISILLGSLIASVVSCIAFAPIVLLIGPIFLIYAWCDSRDRDFLPTYVLCVISAASFVAEYFWLANMPEAA